VVFLYVSALDRKLSPNRLLKGRLKMSVYPTNLTSDRLQLPSQTHAIPPDSKVLGAYWTSDLNTLKPLFLLLLSLIFTASKA
jgi:hypothetical protein